MPGRKKSRRSFLQAVLITLLAGLCAYAGCDSRDRAETAFTEEQSQGYVGSEYCRRCHGPYLPPALSDTYHDDWMNSTHGASSDMTPSDETITADADNNGVTDFNESMELAAAAAWVKYTAAGGADGDFAPALGFDPARSVYTVTIGPLLYDIEKVVGSGREKQAYLTRIGESLYVLPALFCSADNSWVPILPENWFTWDDADSDFRIDTAEKITGVVYASPLDSPAAVGRAGDSWERNCVGCHVTGLTSLYENQEGGLTARYSEDGVTCEACHGPGRLHAYLGGKDHADRAIVNPKKIAADRYADICMSCHTRGTAVGTAGAFTPEFPWHPGGGAFIPGEDLSDSFSAAEKTVEQVHALQGNRVHGGASCSPYGSWSTRCQDCHSAHDTSNLALVAAAVTTPSSGELPVVFTARAGAPGSGGLMGDATDGAFTDICEVCHTQTQYFRNDSSTPDTGHFNGQACTDCHLHKKGFLKPESSGGTDCQVCHDYLATQMGAATPQYRHMLDDTGLAYPLSASPRRCLSCHADHDIFSPDINDSAGRGANIRTEISDAPTISSGYTNSDFENSADGGICLSCHDISLPKSYARPDGSTDTPAIPYAAPKSEQIAAYAAGMHGGTYSVASSFTGAGESVFQADCVKCHNDDLTPKSCTGGQTGETCFGLHVSTRSGMLSPLGYAGSAEPMEENFCYRCHSSPGDAIGGTVKPSAGADWYNATTMSARAEGIFSEIGKAYGHGVGNYSGLHSAIEGASWNWNPAGSRHVECADCHNPHAAGPRREFDTSGDFAQPVSPTNLAASTPLAGVWGVNVSAWPAEGVIPDPATAYTRIDNSTYEWQVCLKCHSGYAYGATPPAGQTDVAREFNPNNTSYHAVIGASKTTFPPDTSFVGPWTNSSAMSCADCHTSDSKDGPQGPHGSDVPGILAGPLLDNTGQTGTENHLCFKCHDYEVYGRGGSGPPSSTGFSKWNLNMHVRHAIMPNSEAGWRYSTCYDCHAAVPHGWYRRALLIAIGDPAPYNTGSAALDASDLSSLPASGDYRKSSCSNSPCH